MVPGFLLRMAATLGCLCGLLVLSVACAAPEATPPTSAAQPTPAAAGAAAKATGTLTVYSALNESTNNAFVESFTKTQPSVKFEEPS